MPGQAEAKGEVIAALPKTKGSPKAKVQNTEVSVSDSDKETKFPQFKSYFAKVSASGTQNEMRA
jgi:hypothetical protein